MALAPPSLAQLELSSPWETLCNELWDSIIAYLELHDITKLNLCSKQLRGRLEPLIYGTKKNLTRAMRWACSKGVPGTIQKTVSYNAPVDYIEIPRKLWWDGGVRGLPVKILTLQLACKHAQYDAFKTLLDLGASLNFELVESDQMRSFWKSLIQYRNRAILNILFERGLHRRISQTPGKDVPLAELIIQGLNITQVRLLLDIGADIDRIGHFKSQYICPLSAAILINSHPIFDLLLEAGANIDGKDIECTYREKPFHLPIFTAVHKINAGGILFLDKGYAKGVRFDRSTEVQSGSHFTASYVRYPTTSLRIYLESIQSWTDESSARHVEVVDLLLERGVKLCARKAAECTSRVAYHGCESATLHDFLLDKWGLENLRHPAFFQTLSRCMHRRICALNFVKFTSKYYRSGHDEIVDLWRRLLIRPIMKCNMQERQSVFLDLIYIMYANLCIRVKCIDTR